MSKTKIPWTERTWNPVTGCSKISEGCRNCYAATMANRLQHMGQYKYKDGFKVTLHWETITEPFRTNKPSMFFVCSMGDLFHKDVPFEFVDAVMKTIEACSHHTFQILTKRANIMHQYFMLKGYVPKNVWLGTTVECISAKERIWYMLDLKHTLNAPVTFLSCEPLLEDLGGLNLRGGGIDWVIVGGESGPKARPMKKEWVVDIQKQCVEQDVPFFFKQWGTWSSDGVKRNKKENGCLLDGEVCQEWPKAWKGVTQ